MITLEEIKQKVNNGNFVYVLIGIILLLLLVQYRSCENKNSEIYLLKQNILAAKDSLYEVKNKNGELQKEKFAIMGSVDELKKYNSQLAEEVDKQRNKVKTITVIKPVVIIDTVQLQTNLVNINDTTNKIFFLYDSKDKDSLRINGHIVVNSKIDTNNKIIIKVGESFLNDFNLTADIVTGFSKNSDGNYVAFAKSSSKYIKINNVSGAILNPQESFVSVNKNWHIGFTMNLGYGSTSNGFSPYLGVGFGVMYSLYGF